jgi:hypothetical protein
MLLAYGGEVLQDHEVEGSLEQVELGVRHTVMGSCVTTT